MQAIGYLSEPELDEADGRATLAEQNSRFLAFCEVRGYEASAAFIDKDLAGERRGFAQLLDHVESIEPGFTVAAVQSVAHLGAEPPQAAMALLQLRSRGARVETFDGAPLDEVRLLRWWRARFPEDRGSPVRDGMRRRAVRGQALGRPPYGYAVGADGRLEAVPGEAELVRYIFRLYLDQELGIRKIAQRLNEEGYRTRRDRPWSMVTIRDLLRNRAYTGTYTRFGVTVPKNHEALITPAEHRLVEQRMAARRTAPGRSDPGEFLLAGLVWCGEDGSRMVGSTRRQSWTRRDGGEASGVYRYYQSGERAHRSVGEYHTRKADELEAEVLRHLRGEDGRGARPGVARAGDAAAVAGETAEALARAEARAKSLDRRLAALLDEASASAVAARSGPSATRLAEEAAPLVAAYETASAEIAALRARLAAQASEGERERRRARLMARLRDEWDELGFEQRRSLLRELVERVTVYDDSVETVLRA